MKKEEEAYRGGRKVDRGKRYSLDEACSLVKAASFAKFDETVDLAVRLGVNPKHADQMVRGALVCPMASVSLFASWCSHVARKWPRPSRPAPTSWAAKTWSPR